MEALLTVGLITDTHIRPPQGDESSPFPVNDLANGRARFATALLASVKPDLTIHLGDMVHTLPHMPTYPSACQEAKSILTPLDPHFVAGNHDVGDKPVLHAPAGHVKDNLLPQYETEFGASWYDFTAGPCHFITVASSLFGTNSEQDLAQRSWLEAVLQTHQDKRKFLLSHYPLFINHTTEQAHYDNWQPEPRAWLLDKLLQHNVEAVFSGHTHQFFYNQVNNTSFYCLPPTSFTRQDYAELYRVEPAPEFGRNDVGKFSVALLHIKDQGHGLKVIPTFGNSLDANTPFEKPALSEPRGKSITVPLRHSWHEANALPANGPMEEFSRKQARNDYMVLRLLQMGIRQLRVPACDLIESAALTRAQDLAALGMAFQVFIAEPPQDQIITSLANAADIISAVEFVSNSVGSDELTDTLKMLTLISKPLILSKSHSSAKTQTTGTQFAHNVSTGFVWEDKDLVHATLQSPTMKQYISQVMIQINSQEDLPSSIARIAQFSDEVDCSVIINLRLADPNPAKSNYDDQAILNAVKQAMELTEMHSRLSLLLDTYMDIDRGYAPRHGLIDRLSNFRSAGLYLAGFDALAHNKETC